MAWLHRKNQKPWKLNKIVIQERRVALQGLFRQGRKGTSPPAFSPFFPPFLILSPLAPSLLLPLFNTLSPSLSIPHVSLLSLLSLLLSPLLPSRPSLPFSLPLLPSPAGASVSTLLCSLHISFFILSLD